MKPRMLNDKYIVSETQLCMIELFPDDFSEIMDSIRSSPYGGNEQSEVTNNGMKVPGELVFDTTPWKMYMQDAGMGEHEYALFRNDVFFTRTDSREYADEIIRSIWRDKKLQENLLQKMTDEIPAMFDDGNYSGVTVKQMITHYIRFFRC